MLGSDFSQTGLPIGDTDANMAYLYGISDFFTTLFENPDRIDLVLESSTMAASEIYSKFLQLTSGLSLEDIQNTIDSQIKLIILRTSDKLQGEVNAYKLPLTVAKSAYIANRPLAPTTLFEEDVDFRFETLPDGTTHVYFSKDISNSGFSSRLTSDGVTTEYALWFVDAKIDERWLSKIYGKNLGLSPSNSTEQFRNFLYGLYYTYTHGPTLADIRKGLNLAIGIPLARDNEKVLDIRMYMETDQYIVIGERNQYLVPYGIVPNVKIGDDLRIGDELALWVEIKDYLQDGDWWLNIYIPQKMIPEIPAGQTSRYATEGSHFDYLMRTYLKTHTFLVNVKVENFRAMENFSEIAQILREARPSYTMPIYIWSVSHEEKLLITDEDTFKYSIGFTWTESLMNPIGRMVRWDQSAPLLRGQPFFLRWSMNNKFSKEMGTDEFVNGHPMPFENGYVDGYVNPNRQFRNNTQEEAARLTTLFTRGTNLISNYRSRMSFLRGTLAQNGHEGVGVRVDYGLPPSFRIVPLYITNQYDLDSKCQSLGIETPKLNEWVFDLLNPLVNSYSINGFAINEQSTPDDPIPDHLRQSFDVLFQRGASVQSLGNVLPTAAYKTWVPDITDLRAFDYLLGVRIYPTVIGIYWVTSNLQVKAPFVSYEQEPDPLDLEYDAVMTRGSNGFQNPAYFLRGRGMLIYEDEEEVLESEGMSLSSFGEGGPTDGALNEAMLNMVGYGNTSQDPTSVIRLMPRGVEINSHEINGSATLDSTLNVNYSDKYNSLRPMRRDGTMLRHRMEKL